MKARTLTATSLRLTLSASLLLITILATVLFYFADRQLHQVAVDVSHTVVDANASQSTIQNLQQVQRQLENNKDVITRAGNIVADSQSYQYQDQIVSDLNTYASKAGIKITNMDFTTEAAASGSTPTTDRGTDQNTTTAPAAPSGVKTTSVTVTMENPVGYSNFLTLLRSIEDNLTKMQVQKVSLSRATGGGGNIASDVLTIQVYVR